MPLTLINQNAVLWMRTLVRIHNADVMTSPDTSPDSIVPAPIRRVLLGACWLTVLYGTAAVTSDPMSARGLAAWASALICLLTFTVAVERFRVGSLLLISGLAGVALQYLAPSNGAFVAVLAVIATAGMRLDPTTSRRVAILSGGGFLIASALRVHPVSGSQVISVIPAFLFTYLGSTAVGRLRTEQQRTADLLAEVVAGQDDRIRAAALDERTHLAREMHDVLAHTLSALSIHLEGTRMLADQRGSDPAISAALERAGALARDGLGEARRAVGSLRGEVLPGPDLLPQLSREFERDTDVPCRLQIEGEAIALSADARLALYRIAQEALTNIRKHSSASAVSIALCYAAGGVDLIIENQGTPVASPIARGGYGLSGMRERAELLNGRLDVGPTATGFTVHLWLPT